MVIYFIETSFLLSGGFLGVFGQERSKEVTESVRVNIVTESRAYTRELVGLDGHRATRAGSAGRACGAAVAGSGGSGAASSSQSTGRRWWSPSA